MTKDRALAIRRTLRSIKEDISGGGVRSFVIDVGFNDELSFPRAARRDLEGAWNEVPESSLWRLWGRNSR